MSLLSTALSFFVTANLGFGRGSFTLYYSLMVAAGAVSASFLAAPLWGMVYDIFGNYKAMPILLLLDIAALVGAFKK